MQPAENLEIKGNLSKYPLAEVLAEASCYALNGSIRLAHESYKIIIYLREGKVAYAASNARQHRLFQLLLNWHQITEEKLRTFENIANDLEFAEKLIEGGLFKQSDIEVIFTQQLNLIMQIALSWKDGEWVYSPLARIKESIGFDFGLHKALFEIARKLGAEEIMDRFALREDIFSATNASIDGINLQAHEGFIYSSLQGPLKIEEILQICGLPDYMALPALYTLWMSGLARRENFDSPFTKEQIERLVSSKFKISAKRPLPKPLPQTPVPGEAPLEESEAPQPEEAAIDQAEETMEAYLERTKKPFSHYEALGVARFADLAAIKKAYFSMAKRFHPDKFHSEGDEIRKGLQHSFTTIAQAYDVLKDSDQRELYDFKLKKRIAAAEQEKAENNGAAPDQKEPDSGVNKEALAKKYFERGCDLLMEGEEEGALAFLANASTLAPDVARYRAYYGKAMVHNSKYRHKTEHEFQAAIKLEPDNISFKIMLIEFYIEVNLMKRADGELSRLLAAYPDNKEAKALLDKIKQK